MFEFAQMFVRNKKFLRHRYILELWSVARRAAYLIYIISSAAGVG